MLKMMRFEEMINVETRKHNYAQNILSKKDDLLSQLQTGLVNNDNIQNAPP